MYPLRDLELSFARVAEEWAYEFAGKPASRSMSSELLKAIWTGELIVRRSIDGTHFLVEDLLKAVCAQKEHPGFTVSARGATQSHSAVDLPDGGVEFDFHSQIALPSNPAKWTQTAIEKAISILGEKNIDEFHSVTRTGINCLLIRREDLADFCKQSGYPLPKFWFGTRTPRTSIAKAEYDCASWLHSLAKRPKQYPKAWYREQAIQKFPGLTDRGFVRAWSKTVPRSWRSTAGPRR